MVDRPRATNDSRLAAEILAGQYSRVQARALEDGRVHGVLGRHSHIKRADNQAEDEGDSLHGQRTRHLGHTLSMTVPSKAEMQMENESTPMMRTLVALPIRFGRRRSSLMAAEPCATVFVSCMTSR